MPVMAGESELHVTYQSQFPIKFDVGHQNHGNALARGSSSDGTADFLFYPPGKYDCDH